MATPTRVIQAVGAWSLIAAVAACGGGRGDHDRASGAALAAAEPAQATASPASEGPGAEQTAKSPKSAAQLTRVDDSSTVCMVNNQYMGQAQIPVVVEGRTYFGCCEMCRGRLQRDRSARFAADPVSGRPVDKATAIIGRDASNHVLYFESEDTYRRYAGS